MQYYHWLGMHIEELILADVQGGLNVRKRFWTYGWAQNNKQW